MADLDTSTNFDAEQLKEDISKGETKKLKVDLDADYELSKEFSVAEVDKTDAGAEAAAVATENKFELTESQPVQPQSAEPTGNPEDFLKMAKEINPLP
ncbi:MAG: hypothetical protein KME15_20405 [Drouetiella hepatica Uher 2000/2452]|jgi:predicted porin|uniref:Uncharacterized protein n=1 Tax=Drouetiella hepatica Uher 2000/2452 TaxID=904376 RepID=A0A951QE91_9CYAN|nr:hypothetical protein [Drouetiella hepatica Uher 2000/2452]